MNRHHPYGGVFENAATRRGGSSSGPGPDRSHRYTQERGGAPTRGRGFGRGRGGYGSFNENFGAYDHGPPQGEMGGAYNNYDAPPQDPFYQNGYGNTTPAAQFGAPSGPPDNFSQVYGNYEDAAGYGGEAGYGNRPPKRNIRREKDDKLHDSIIEERIQRERPCRTLFIRNIKYETNSDDIRRQFEEHGEIKTFFDLIATRGMVFVTYYDLRAAERARDRSQGSEISGRPIDVHYSLPRDDHSSNDRGEKNLQLQGTVQVTLRNSVSGAAIDDAEVRRKFQQFGDVKSVKAVGDRADSRYVEFYDIRACEEAYDRLRHQGLQDGVMDIVLAWDVMEGSGPPGAGRRDDRTQEGGRDWDGRGYRGRGGGRGRGRGRGRGYDDDWDRRGDYGRDRGDRRRYEDDYGGRGGRGGGHGDRFDSRAGGYGGEYGMLNGQPPYNQPPPGPPGPPVDDRLEQARKVQQLLAALKQPQNGTAPHVGPPPAPQTGPTPGMPPGPPPPNSFYPPPSALQQPNPPYPGSIPPTNGYGSMPPPATSQPGPPPPASGLANLPLPPNILALLQQQTTQAPQMTPQQNQTPQYGMAPPQIPPSLSNMPPGQVNQQLMAYLQTQQVKRP